MSEPTLTVARVLTDEIKGKNIPIMGGDDNNPTWDEYLKIFREQYRPHMEVLKAYVKEHHYQTSGQYHNEYSWQFSDGFCMAFTCRAWGDFMQAVVGEREGYMAYYM